MKKILLLVFTTCYSIGYSQVVISSLNTPSTQNFNTLVNSGNGNTWADNFTITGWYASSSIYNTSAGTSTTGALYSLGASANTDRALGSLASGGLPVIRYGARIKNSSGVLIKSLTISYTGEQWRSSKTAPETLTFDYRQAPSISDLIGTYTLAPELNFVTPNLTGDNSIDGNLASNRIVIISTLNIDIPAGEEVMLRWTDLDDTGSDHAMGIDDFSVTAYSTLPISLTSFTAKAIDKSIILNWETSSESNNALYEIERSFDGKSFSKIGELAGVGTTSAMSGYSFRDDNPFPGTNYYRLVQYDTDGKSSVSLIQAVDSKLPSVSLYAYIQDESVGLNIMSPQVGDAKIALFNVTGKKLTEKAVSLNKGINQFTFSERLNSGVYFFNLFTSAGTSYIKFIK